MKPQVTLVARHIVSEGNLSKIASQLGVFCQSPPWKVCLHESNVGRLPVYTFTSTRKNVPLKTFNQCHAYVSGIQFGINHA